MLDFTPNRVSQQQAINEALENYERFKLKTKEITQKDKIVVVNMEEPSYRKRLYLYNLETQQCEREHHCSHGVGSSNPNSPENAIAFSNTPKSRKTSLGAMYTGETFSGKHGKSLRLHGLEKGINDNVYKRGIIIHGAYYCTDEYIYASQKCGRSWGCFAVDPAILNGLIGNIKNGMFLYCYRGE